MNKVSRHFVVLLGATLFILSENTAAEPTRVHYKADEQAYAVPDQNLIDSNGHAVNLKALLEGDQPVMLNFVYASCTTTCPMLAATFARANKLVTEANKPVQFVSVSIDPEQDTPAQLKAYAERFKAGANWHFLTGELAAIEAVQKAFDAYRGGKANHPSLFLIHARPKGPWIRLEGAISATELVNEFYKAEKDH